MDSQATDYEVDLYAVETVVHQTELSTVLTGFVLNATAPPHDDDVASEGIPPLFPSDPVRDPLYIVIPITILYAIIFLTGLIGNIVTCIVICRNKHMHTATNYYLFSLAISDLLLLVSGLPQEMYTIWSRYPYVFGEAFCVLRGLAAEMSTNATVLTITAFTVERYVAICHPFLTQTMSKLSRAVKIILAIWCISFAFAVPQAIQFGVIDGGQPDRARCMVKRIIMKHSFELSTFLFFVAPMTLIMILYALIGLRLHRSSMMKRNSGSFCRKDKDGQGYDNKLKHSSCRHAHSQSSRRVLKMLVAVVVAFFICWAPFHAQRLVAIYSSQSGKPRPLMLTIYTVVTYISGILYYVSTTINPILYQIMSLKFREAFKDTLGRFCGIRGRRTRRSYSILSRSAQRHPSAVGSVGQPHESTSCSGNSESGGGVGVGGGAAGRQQRSVSESGYSVVLSTRHGGAVVPALSRQSTRCSQRPFLVGDRGQCLPEDPKPSYLRRLFPCVHGSSSASLDSAPSYLPPDSSHLPQRESEAFTMIPVTYSNLSNISNSSLRDVDRNALGDELTSYMEELSRRERC